MLEAYEDAEDVDAIGEEAMGIAAVDVSVRISDKRKGKLTRHL
jgi:hypothetical protein